jgi:transcriptional regulator with XRE-family HTH domain
MSLATNLRKLRLESGESLQAVATAIGRAKPHVWELENGRAKNPTLRTLKRLAKHYNTKVYLLIGERP